MNRESQRLSIESAVTWRKIAELIALEITKAYVNIGG